MKIKNNGLCHLLLNWCVGKPVDIMKVVDEFSEHLITAGLCRHYPFDGEYYEYYKETAEGIAHLNPNRIKWIQDHLNDMNQSETLRSFYKAWWDQYKQLTKEISCTQPKNLACLNVRSN